MSVTLNLALQFKRRYPMTIAWRIPAHVRVIEEHLDSDEEVLYAFLGQKNLSSLDIVNTNIIVLTSKRIMVASKRVLFGYHFRTITPDMYNDFTIHKRIFWGKVIIDTVKEKVILSNISANALPEIETVLTDYIVQLKKELGDL